jgi:hypothetical protein
MKSNNLQLSVRKLGCLSLLPGGQTRYALLICLGTLGVTAGCAVYKVPEQDRLAFGRATAVVGEVRDAVDSAKVSTPAKGQAQVVLESILRSQATLSGYLDRGKIEDGEIENFRKSLTFYHEMVPEFVKVAAADRNHYSISRAKQEQLTKQAESVKAALAEILANLDAYNGERFAKKVGRIRFTVQTLGTALVALDESAIKKLDAKRGQLTDTDINNRKAQWVAEVDKWLQGISTSLKAVTDRVDGKVFNADGLVKVANLTLGNDSDPMVELGLRFSLSTVNGLLPQGTLSEDSKRVLGVLQTEFDKIAVNYRTRHNLNTERSPAI